ncbi:AMP-binding protein [Corynebacterium sp.]|uniref:AMP-binding protein n=1 Tax=Corynebacterium sp. TaxID=1720 RepID=UPI0025B7D366|nr:AMP-binding protein [Corynebacterium sp.]
MTAQKPQKAQCVEPELGFPLSEIPVHYAAQMPDTVVAEAGGETLTWADLERRSERAARGLTERGSERGRIVSLLIPNSVDLVVAVFACYRAGAAPQVLSPRMTAHELTAILELGDPAAVVVADDGSGPDLPGTVTLSELSDGHADESPESPETSEPQVAVAWKAPVSGGSTGCPKIILSGREAVTSEFDPTFWGIGPGERSLITAPLFHNAPLNTALCSIFRGGSVSLLSRFDPEATLAEIDRFRATWVYLVPTMMRRILALPPEVRASYSLDSVRSFWHCAEPCPAWLKAEWIDWVGAERLWELYAGTEAEAGCTIRGDEWLRHRGSVGRVTWGQVILLDEDGDEITEPGVTGEVFMRPPEGMPPTYRYIGAEPRTHDGWSSLGDMGHFDGDGYLYLHDRSSDMVTVGGVNIYPAEIEAALMEHPRVLTAVVIGLPDPDTGNRLHAILNTADGGVTDIDLTEFLTGRLSRNKLPRSYETVTEPLRDDAGKVRRPALRAARLTTQAPTDTSRKAS